MKALKSKDFPRTGYHEHQGLRNALCTTFNIARKNKRALAALQAYFTFMLKMVHGAQLELETGSSKTGMQVSGKMPKHKQAPVSTVLETAPVVVPEIKVPTQAPAQELIPVNSLVGMQTTATPTLTIPTL